MPAREDLTKRSVLSEDIEAVGKRPSAPLPSSLVTAAYFYVRFIPRDFVPQQGLRDGHFPSASISRFFDSLYL